MARFSRELKDFVLGFGQGQKIMSNMEESELRKKRSALTDEQLALAKHKNSPEMRALDVKGAQARIGSLEAGAEAQRGRSAYYRKMIELADQPAPAAEPINVPAIQLPGATEAPTEPVPGMEHGGAVPDREELLAAARAIGSKDPHIQAMESAHYKRRPALPMEPMERPALPMEPGEREHMPEGKMRKRKAKSYEDGGPVEDDADSYDPMDDDDFDVGLEVSKAALTAYAQQPGAAPAAPGQGIPTLRRPQRPVAFPPLQQRRAQAAPPVQVDQVEKQLDPEGKLSPSYRKVLAMGVITKHYIGQGNPQAARNAAISLAQNYAVAFDQWSAVARAAAEGGDPDGAAKAMVRAYENVPAGIDFKVVKQGAGYAYEFIDEKTGKTMRKGIMSPKQLMGAAMQMSEDGAEVLVAEAAGMRAKTDKKGAARAPKPDDTEKRGKMLNEALPKTSNADGATVADPKLDLTRGITDSLMKSNDVQPEEAASMAQALIDPTKNPRKKEAEGGAIYSFPGGKRFFLPDDLIEQISEIRRENAPVGDVPPGRSRAVDDPVMAKEGFLEGISDAASQSRGPLPTAGAVGDTRPAPTVGRQGALPIANPDRSIPLDEVPPEWIPNRGLGER